MRIPAVLRNATIYLAIGMVLALFVGCSGGGSQPTVPGTDNVPAVTGDMANGHNILGIYTITIDPVNMTADIVLDRTASKHWNVAPFLIKHRPDCIGLMLTGVDYDEHIYYVLVSLKNPMFHVGYNVKGIIIRDGSGEVDLVNPDVFTGLWCTEISPFRYFGKEQPNMIFPPAAVYAENFRIYISPDHTPTFDIDFAIDAHYPGVQEDPIWIKNIEVQNNGVEITIDCDVEDAQDNIERVWADTTLFTGGMTDFVNVAGDHYRAIFPIGSAPGGLREILISAKSEGTDVLLHHYAEVFIEAGGAILEGNVFNAISMQKAKNTKLTVTNTVSGGFEPPPTIIDETGGYFYSMEPGSYNVEVVSYNSIIQYDKMDTIYPVVISPDDHVVVDFGIGPSYLDDEQDQICCINGQVYNANTGKPIQNAQISIDGGEQTGGVFQSRVTDAWGHYVFWKVPCRDNKEPPQLIESFTIDCVCQGYVPAKREDVPFGWNKNTPQENFYLVPVGGECYWEETFEDGGLPGWTYEEILQPVGGQIPCAMMWQIHEDYELYNVNLTMVADDGGWIVELPPDDTSGGRVWEPWEGTWGLWYGEDDDGSFVQEWAGNHSGGTSQCAHGAAAMSPIIDITSLDAATMTWQQIWEIEGVDPSIQYDYMRVFIRDVDDPSPDPWFLFEHSNPLTEPVPDLGDGNAKHPQTSGGFDIAPVWQAIVHNIGDLDDPDTIYVVEHESFVGKVIQFRFEFGTVDPLYNGFRGWLVDDLCLYPYAQD
jgi:hypothetical protein